MAKVFTTDYEHFADENMGLLPYIASSVKELIQSEETEKLHKLQEDIAFVADSLYDLLDEVDAAVKKYEQMKNKIMAIEAAMAEKQSALQAARDEMMQTFGERTDDTPELVLESAEGTKVVKVADEPADVMSEEMKTLMDEMLTIENVVGVEPAKEDELRDIGLVFNDEIDEIAAQEANQSFDIEEDDDDGLYSDFGLPEEDVDNGYKPLSSIDSGENDDYSLDVLTEPEPEEQPPASTNDDDFMNILEDDDFLTMFDDDDNPITDDELVMDDDEFAVIDVDDDYMDNDDTEDENETDDTSVSAPESSNDDNDDNDNMPSGFVPPDFF